MHLKHSGLKHTIIACFKAKVILIGVRELNGVVMKGGCTALLLCGVVPRGLFFSELWRETEVKYSGMLFSCAGFLQLQGEPVVIGMPTMGTPWPSFAIAVCLILARFNRKAKLCNLSMLLPPSV